jgi:CHAT domain-containing protein
MQIQQLTLMRQEAMLDFEEGRLPQAEAQLSDILGKLRSFFSDNRYELCFTLLNRATVLTYANRWEEALKDLSECADIGVQLKRISSQAILVTVYQQQAKLYGTAFSSVFNPDAARQAISNLQSLGYSNWIVDYTLAELAYQERDWQSAASGYCKISKDFAKGGWLRAVASCHLRCGRAFLELNELDSAADDLSEALSFFQKYGPPDILASAKMQMGRLRTARGDFEEAWLLAESALDLVESGIRKFGALFDQQRFVIDKLLNYHYAFAIALAEGGDEGIWRAWTVAERAKSFYLCQLVANGDIDLFDGVDQDKLAELRDLELQLDELEARRSQINNAEGDRLSTIEADFNRVSKAKEKLQESMMRTNPRWGAFKTPPRLDLRTELKKLDSKWVPLSYFWETQDNGARLHLFHVDSNRHPVHASVEWSKTHIDELNNHRETLRGVLPPFARIFPDGIAEKILPLNIANQIEPGRRLLISPHEHLRMLPLHALPIDENRRLIDLYPVQYIPTLALLQLRRGQRAEDILLMGCERNGFEKDPPLKHVRDELDTLYEAWSSRTGKIQKVLLASNSSPEACGLSPQNWRDFDVLHFACHGEFPEDRPFDAGLRLGNDAVRTSEFFGIQLKASLVSLSACALGRQTRHHSGLKLSGDEWVGLYLPLFYAGARCVVASLWDANSQVAALFMKEFHRRLSNGAGIASAFQQAISSVSKKPAPFWANWYLVGFPE